MMQPFKDGPDTWNTRISRLANPHLLQCWEWAQVKTATGWQPMPYVWTSRSAQGSIDAAAMVLKRSIPLAGFARRMCVLYVPKGPLLEWEDKAVRDRVLSDLKILAKEQGAIFIKMDPDAWLGSNSPVNEQAQITENGRKLRSDLEGSGWRFSPDQIQFRNTVMIDLSASESEMLERMKQKARYNVRLAQRKGVTVRPGTSDDLEPLFRMYAETSLRDGFAIREKSYYLALWKAFLRPQAGTDQPFAEPLIAEFDGRAIAAVMIFYFAGRAYYMNGMSCDAHREKMPNHLLQWEAMKRAKQFSCKTYDLWGAPGQFTESDPLWGVYRFKEGLGGRVYLGLGAWDHSPNPMLYGLYTGILPKVLGVMRLQGRARTRRFID